MDQWIDVGLMDKSVGHVGCPNWCLDGWIDALKYYLYTDGWRGWMMDEWWLVKTSLMGK